MGRGPLTFPATAPDHIVGPDVPVPGWEHIRFPLAVLVLVLLVGATAVAFLVHRFRRRRTGEPKRPIVTSVLAVGALLTGGVAIAWRPPPFFVPTFPALPRLLPAETFYYRTVGDLQVSPDSGRWIRALGSLPLGLGLSNHVFDGVVYGMPFNLVDRSTPREDVAIILWPDTSFRGPYPITDPAYIQSMPGYSYDQHYIGVDTEQGEMWELLAVRRWFGRWRADSGAHVDLRSSRYPDGSTTAAGLPVLPGTLTYDEVASGQVAHVLSVAGEISRRDSFIWPARGTDGQSDDPDAPPMGAWLRLRADVPIAELPPQARAVATAMRDYGIVFSDTGPGFALTGTPDRRWDMEDLASLTRLTTDDFEVVDASGVVVSADSMAANPAPR